MTTESLHQSLERIRALSPKLNEATDQANEVVAAVVTFLNKDCSIGLPASAVVYKYEDQEDNAELLVVSYERWNGEYQIVVTLSNVCGATCEADIEVRKAWDQCPRDLKLKALRKLPELLHNIAERAEKLIVETTRTAEVIGDMLGALREQQPEPDPQPGDIVTDGPDGDVGIVLEVHKSLGK